MSSAVWGGSRRETAAETNTAERGGPVRYVTVCQYASLQPDPASTRTQACVCVCLSLFVWTHCDSEPSQWAFVTRPQRADRRLRPGSSLTMKRGFVALASTWSQRVSSQLHKDTETCVTREDWRLDLRLYGNCIFLLVYLSFSLYFTALLFLYCVFLQLMLYFHGAACLAPSLRSTHTHTGAQVCKRSHTLTLLVWCRGRVASASHIVSCSVNEARDISDE